MSKNEKALLTFVGITLIIIGFMLGRFSSSERELQDTEDYSEKSTTCNEIPQLYQEIDNKKIFIKCIDMLSLNINGKKMSLKEYLKNNSVDSIIEYLDASSHLNDGGTVIYKDGGTTRISDNGITVIKCNKLSSDINEPNNQDIYIGPENLEYEESFCESSNDDNFGKNLVKTYEILNIADSNEEEYLWLTLRQYMAEEVNSVRVPRVLAKNVLVGKNYEFTFKITNGRVNFENTKELFEKLELLKIEKTDKLGIDQINEIIK